MKKQVVRFGLVGIINTTVDVGSFVALVYLGVPSLVAIFVSTSLGLLCSFALNRSFVFGASQTSRQTVALFLLVTCFGLWILQPLVIEGLALLLRNNSELALSGYKLIATGVTMVWNFYWYRSKVFRTK